MLTLPTPLPDKAIPTDAGTPASLDDALLNNNGVPLFQGSSADFLAGNTSGLPALPSLPSFSDSGASSALASAAPSGGLLSSTVASPTTTASGIAAAPLGSSEPVGTVGNQTVSANAGFWGGMFGRIVVGVIGLMFVGAGLFMLHGRGNVVVQTAARVTRPGGGWTHG